MDLYMTQITVYIISFCFGLVPLFVFFSAINFRFKHKKLLRFYSKANNRLQMDLSYCFLCAMTDCVIDTIQIMRLFAGEIFG